jgi:FKBP-type peptidyl-prolyl cis-trans isomerase
MRLIFLIFLTAILTFSSCENSLYEEKRIANELKIEEYLSLNKYSFTKKDGIYIVIQRKGYGYSTIPGDSIAFYYVGYTLSGNVFDTNIREVALKENLNQSIRNFDPITSIVDNNNLIEGLSIGLNHCRESEWTSLFFPSTSGYADNITGIVDKWSPLAFDVFIIYVKNEKINQEQNNINNFVGSSQGFTKDTTGIWFKYTTEVEFVNKPQGGDTIYGWYKASTLNLEVIEELPNESQEIVLDENLLAVGLILGFQKMDVGEAIKMVVPSYLGYGIDGGGKVEPYTPLVYELKLDSIKQ